MAQYETSLVVKAPLEEVYNQWTQFEEFPSFMKGVEEVRQLDDQTLLWRVRIGGSVKEWEADIVDQTPNRRIAWRSLVGAENAGAVLFARHADGTRVALKLVYEPEGATETLGDALGFVKRRVDEDLHRFKIFIEQRQSATGAWRGEIHGSQVRRDECPR